MKKRSGSYGYLEGHLLRLDWKLKGDYAFWTNDKEIIEMYGFVGVKNEYWDHVNYFLKIDDPSTVSAYSVETYCRYKGLRFWLYYISEERVYTMFPDDEAMVYLKDYPRHGYDPVYYASEEEVTDVWEERSPIEGFRFDVEPIVYLKQDGVFLVDSPLSPMSSARSETKKDELVYLGLSNEGAKAVPLKPKRKQVEAVDKSEPSEEEVEENAYDILLEEVGGIVITLLVIGAFLLIAYFFDRCV